MKFVVTLLLALLFITPMEQPVRPLLPDNAAVDALPLLFTAENHATGSFSAVGLGGRLIFTANEVSVALPNDEGIQIRFLEANPAAGLTAAEQQPGVINHYRGSDSAQWQSGIPTYAALTYKNLYKGIDLRYDVILTRLNPAGDGLVYSIFLGGSGSPDDGSGRDEGRTIALDPQGNIYVTGFTYAADFPTVNAAYSNYPDPNNKADAWVTKLSPDGQTVLYSTYLGADDDDQAQNIVADAQGNAYVLGYTRSTNFPILDAIQNNRGEGGVCFIGSTQRYCYDSFITKLTSTGSLSWSTYLGDGWDEYGYGLARDDKGVLYVAGVTNSPDYPITSGAPQQTLGGNEDGFITKITTGGSTNPPPPPPGDVKVFLPMLVR